LWAAGSGGRCIRRWGSSVLRRPAAEVRRGSDGRWSGCRQRVSGRRGARMRAEVSGVSCVGLWVLHPSGCGDVGEACGMSGFGCQRAVHRVVGSGGQACGVSGFWGQRPCVGLQVALVSRQCVGRWGVRRAVPRTRGGRRWGPAPDPGGSTAMDNLGAALRRELVVLVQKKPQSSDLKLMNSVLWGRNSWKVLPRPWCSWLVSGKSKSHLLLLP
jgi:hypothetical protein